MKDINDIEIKANDTVRFCPKDEERWDVYVIDEIEGGFVAMHNVFGPLFLSADAGYFEVIPERVLTNADFKSKRE